MPAVSVIMPVYNRETLAPIAVRSIVAQGFADWELVVVDDGSSDGSVAAVEAIGDPRVRVIRHDANAGEAAARNTGLMAAQGRYIAWLDSDDVARPERLARQVAFLDAHPDVALLGTAAGKIDVAGRPRPGLRRPPTDHDDIAAWLLFRSAFQQSSVMGRTAILRDYRYDPGFPICTDMDVFVRLLRDHRLANLPDVLIDRRMHPAQMVQQQKAGILAGKVRLSAPRLHAMGMAIAAGDMERHALLGQADLDGADVAPDFLPWADRWLRAMRAANRRTRVADPAALDFATGWFWLLACRAAAPRVGRGAALAALVRSPLALSLAGPRARAWLGRTAGAARAHR